MPTETPSRWHAGAAEHYALSRDKLHFGVLGAQIQLLEAYLTSQVNLDRDGVRCQGAGTFDRNVRGWIARFLGFYATQRGMQRVEQLGMLTVRTATRGRLLLMRTWCCAGLNMCDTFRGGRCLTGGR